jgi:hypothetical protein
VSLEHWGPLGVVALARDQPMRMAMMPFCAVGLAAVTDPLSVPIGGVKA